MSKRRAPAASSTAAQAFASSTTIVSAFTRNAGVSTISYISEPLDLSVISDSTVVVLFKNLSKQHENTKAKALEELQGIIEGLKSELEDGVLSAWIQIYPRLSVDSSKRVRQLTHTLHASISSASGKRLAKFMPQIVGPWLAGAYDNDQTVCRAARESLSKVFNPTEKLKKVWEVFHATTLEYQTNVIMNETIHTLSDERQTTSDDAEAKYARVIAASISSVRHLLLEASDKTIAKDQSLYIDILSNSGFWKFGHHSDPYVRKSIYSLLQTCLNSHKELIEPYLEIISASLITKGCSTAQLGSTSEFLDTVLRLTRTFPNIWLTLKPKKSKPPVTIINQFVKLGSQGASDYWTKILHIIDTLPNETLPKSKGGVMEMLDAFLTGITETQEPRIHTITSWATYLGVCLRLLTLVDLEEEAKVYIIDDGIWPLYEEYLRQEGTRKKYILHASYRTAVCAGGLLKLLGPNPALEEEPNVFGNNPVLQSLLEERLWGRMVDMLLSELETSGASDEEAEKRRENLEAVGDRWLGMVGELYRNMLGEGLPYEVVRTSTQKVLQACVTALETSNDRAKIAAELLRKGLASVPSEVWTESREFQTSLSTFFEARLPELVPSPIFIPLLRALVLWLNSTNFGESLKDIWTRNVKSTLSNTYREKDESVRLILSETPVGLAGKLPFIPELEAYVANRLRAALEEDDVKARETVRAAFKSQGVTVSKDFPVLLLSMISNGLEKGGNSVVAILTQLSFVAQRHFPIFAEFFKLKTGEGEKLLHNLIALSDPLEDEAISTAAQLVSDQIRTGLQESKYDDLRSSLLCSLSRLIPELVLGKGMNMISVDHLIKEAMKLYSQAQYSVKYKVAETLVCTENQWAEALMKNLSSRPDPSLALANSLGGAISLIQTHNIEDPTSTKPKYDVEGYSSALRMAMYTNALLKYAEKLDYNPRVCGNMHMKVLFVTELAQDGLSLGYVHTGEDIQANHLWHISSDYNGHDLNPIDIDSIISDFIADVQSYTKGITRRHEGLYKEDRQTQADVLIQNLITSIKDRTLTAFYSARVLCSLLSDMVETNGYSREVANTFATRSQIRNTQNVFLGLASYTGLSRLILNMEDTNKLRNSLAGDLIGMKAEDKNLEKVVLLNALMPKPDDDDISFPQQRALLLVKSLLGWFGEGSSSSISDAALVCETAKLFRSLLPYIKEVYGSQWEHLCNFVLAIWQTYDLNGPDPAHIPTVFSSLKLYESLKHSYSSNDDFEDAWNAVWKQFHKGLQHLLETSTESDELHQPRMLLNELLCRQFTDIPLDNFEDMDGIFPLLTISSKSIQMAAFEILHQWIPLAQENISLEAALGNLSVDEPGSENSIQLPLELLSILMEAPSARELEESSILKRSMPVELRGYLLTWVLIFDHFEKASFKVKTAYTANLQEGGYLSSLLDFTFDFLGHTRGKAFDAERIISSIITSPSSSAAISSTLKLLIDEDPIPATKNLLAHLYYLSLLHTPSLTKSWWLASTNRQTVLAVETFTEKFLSPIIIDNALTSVSAWISPSSSSSSSTTPSTADPPPADLKIKISRPAREVTATYPIDDQSISLTITLPPPFPLRPATISSPHKIGLTDRQWKALQLSSQAVISLQGGTIIDALTLFHKNLTLHFQGVAECSICYSIIGGGTGAGAPGANGSGASSLPNKSCVTCRNKFHAGCLYKWFKSSNSSSCPLCRTSWQFYAGGLAH